MSRLLLRCSLAALASVAVAASFPSAGHADTFPLTSDHCTGDCLTGQISGGTVTVTQSGTNQLTFDVALANGNKFVNTGFEADFGFNLDPNQTITYSGVTVGWTPVGGNPTGAAAGGLHMDGAGFFEYGLLCTICGSGGSNPFAGPLDFTITGTNLTLASLQQNPVIGNFFAVDMISGTTGKTGAVDASVRNVPGPIVGAGLPGLIAACGGLLALGRRRRQRIA